MSRYCVVIHDTKNKLAKDRYHIKDFDTLQDAREYLWFLWMDTIAHRSDQVNTYISEIDQKTHSYAKLIYRDGNFKEMVVKKIGGTD